MGPCLLGMAGDGASKVKGMGDGCKRLEEAMARITLDGIARAYGGKPRSEEDYALKPLRHVIGLKPAVRCINLADRAKTPGIRGEAARRASGEGIGALGLIGRLTRPKRRPGPQCAPIEPRSPSQAATAAVMASTPRMLSARRKL